MNTSFQLLVYIMKVKSQEEQKFFSSNFIDAMWKHPIILEQAMGFYSFPLFTMSADSDINGGDNWACELSRDIV